MSGALPLRAPLFPLAGAILFPRAQLPLHIFEPRYRELVRDAVDGDGVIAIVQPQLVEVDDDRKQPLYPVGCVGEIVGLEELEDGRFNIVLNGSNRFRIVSEIDLETPYRNADLDVGALASLRLAHGRGRDHDGAVDGSTMKALPPSSSVTRTGLAAMSMGHSSWGTVERRSICSAWLAGLLPSTRW